MPPTQSLDPADTGPRLKVEGLIWKSVPENVIETVALESQGTFRMSISRSISEATITHEHTCPGPLADSFRARLGARNCGIYGLYTLGATNDQGATSINDSALATNNSLPVDGNTVELALPVTLQNIDVNSESNAPSCLPTCVVTGM
jgi:hypothetical protein